MRNGSVVCMCFYSKLAVHSSFIRLGEWLTGMNFLSLSLPNLPTPGVERATGPAEAGPVARSTPSTCSWPQAMSRKEKVCKWVMEGALWTEKKRPSSMARARRRPRFVFVQGDQARRSTIMAMPWPPPTHMVSRPKVLSALCNPFSSVVMIRAPVMP